MTMLSVCQAPPVLDPAGSSWQECAADCRRVASDIVVLNELPFGPWIATAPDRNNAVIAESQAIHRAGVAQLAELGAEVVLGSRAVDRDGANVNEAFVWSTRDGLTATHTKQFFPDEEGYWEARWYDRGTRRFELGKAGPIRVGFLLCTDIMFLEWARYYGRQGAHLIAVPRATPSGTIERWRTVMSAAAIISGCYVASSNRVGMQGHMEFAGHAWIFHPSGELLVETSDTNPVVAAEIDPAEVENAQRDYPCYVKELST